MKRIVAFLFTIIYLVGCSSDDSNSLLVFNAIDGAAVMDLLVDNDLKVERLA